MSLRWDNDIAASREPFRLPWRYRIAYALGDFVHRVFSRKILRD